MKEPSLLKTLLLLFLVDVGLRTLGFERVYQRVRRIQATSRDGSLTQAALQRVLSATALYPGRSMCLEQSLAIAVLLRRRGVDARVRLAVQHYPFAAHSWVEIDGVSVTESPEVVQRFVPLPEVA